MTCQGAAELHFEVSGVKIRPYELDVRSNTEEDDFCQATVSQEAADVIATTAFPLEPVSVMVDGERIFRVLVPQDEPIDTTSETPIVHFVSQMKVLNSGVIDGQSDTFTPIGDVIREVVGRVDDPYNVITDVRFHGTFDQTALPQTPNFASDEPRDFIEAGWKKWSEIVESTYDVMDDLAGDYIGRSAGAGFTFDHVSPRVALAEIQGEYPFNCYIDRDGVFWVGIPDHSTAIFVVGKHRNMISLKDYSVSNQHSPLKTVVVVGGKVTNVNKVMGNGYERGSDKYLAMAKATRTDLTSDRTDAITVEVEEIDGNTLQRIAYGTLNAEIQKRNNGQMTLNGFTGTDLAGDLRDMVVGANVLVTPYEECHREIPGGLFTVTGYQHQFNTMDGWAVNLDVAHNTISQENVATEFFLFDPYTGEEIEPSGIYK